MHYYPCSCENLPQHVKCHSHVEMSLLWVKCVSQKPLLSHARFSWTHLGSTAQILHLYVVAIHSLYFKIVYQSDTNIL